MTMQIVEHDELTVVQCIIRYVISWCLCDCEWDAKI